METTREQLIKEAKLREQMRTVNLIIPVRSEKHQALVEMARKSGRESLTFFKNPALLECSFCPCANADGVSCTMGVDETCASAFYRFVFEEVDNGL
jgi:hypothetical protein